MKRKFLGAACLAAMFVSAPVHAAVSVKAACANDLTLAAGSSLAACSSRFDGNLLDNLTDADVNAALTKLGYSGPAITYRALSDSAILDSLNGSRVVNFPGTFNGTVYLGVRYGDAKGGAGKSMMIYKIDASDLDKVMLNRDAGSNVVVLAAVPGRLPEAATWGMLLVGFGAIGFALRKAKAIADARFEEKLRRLAAGETT